MSTKAMHSHGQSSSNVEVVSIQPISIVDHVCKVDADTLASLIPDELGGSHRVGIQEIERILASVPTECISKAGGSASNVMRGLAGFGVRAKLVGARGSDQSGALFYSSMAKAGVNVKGVVIKPGTTGRCCILSCQGQRTMRTCLDGAARLDATELNLSDFAGSKYVFLSGYCAYNTGLLEKVIDLAREASAGVALDLASFEIVRSFRSLFDSIIKSRMVDIIFANEDEATEWARGAVSDANDGSSIATPEAGLHLLSQHCRVSVVTLGERGCLVKLVKDGDQTMIVEPAAQGVQVVDTTGAGDLFAAGFLYSMLQGYSVRRAAQVGCLAGGAIVQTLGSEMSQVTWAWLKERMQRLPNQSEQN